MKKEIPGCFNAEADKIPRVDKTWSDTNLTSVNNTELYRLKCRHCGKTNEFEILQTGDWETTSRCSCGMYYIVHTG